MSDFGDILEKAKISRVDFIKFVGLGATAFFLNMFFPFKVFGQTSMSTPYKMPHLFTSSEIPSKGRWEVYGGLSSSNTALIFSPVLAIHAALLRTGKVLFIGGSQNDLVNLHFHDYRNVVWDPSGSPSINKFKVYDSTDENPIHPTVDIFCSGHTFLENGKLLICGGTKSLVKYEQNRSRPYEEGLNSCFLFDPITERFFPTRSMKDQRWYPTVVYLNNDQNFNGCISVAGQIVPGKFAHVPEIYDPIKQTWDKLSYDGWFYYRSILSEESSPVPMPEWPLYPSIFLLGSGYLFYTGCHTFGGFADLSPGLIEIKTDIDPTTGKPKKAYTYYPIPVTQSFRDHLPYRDQGASVLLPPAQDQKIILIGGGRQDGHMGEGFGGRAITNVDLIDLSNIPLKSNKKPYDSLEGYKKLPQFEPTMRLNYARIHLNAIILPDRTVMVCGGNKYGEDDVTGIIDQNIVEIYNPALHTPDTMSTWWQGAKAQITRAYHSLAVLLPDGSVITAGSNPDRKPYDKVPSERHPNAPDIPISVRGNNRYELETYYPPYYDYPRPSINNSPEDILYGGDMDIDTDESFEIDWAHLVRPMAVTHSMDTDQRLVDLPIKQRQLGRISVDVTHEPNLAPPGWYMLFIAKILSDTEIPRAVPSVAKWVHLSGIKYKNQFGMFGINGGQFNSPTGIAACKVLEPDEGFRIYVCDNINDRIQMFNRFIYSYMGTIGPRLSTPSSIPPSSPNYKTTKINHPISITSNSFGEIYFTNAGEHHIVRMKPNGDLLGTFGSFGTGNGQFNTPWGIAIDSSNQVYVTENGPRIQVFSRDGRYIRQFGSRGDGPGQFSLLYGIAIDKNNHIFTSDPIHQKIIKFDRNGKFISSWGGVSGSGEGQFSVPRNIAIDSLNRIYVVDKFNNRVQVFDDQGNFLMKFGSHGSGKGQFNSPDGIAIDPFDIIYVADTDNHRIQVFSNLIK